MRLTTIVSEAARNVASGTTRAVLFALLLGSIAGGLAVADATAVHTLESQAQIFRSSGAATRILQSETSIQGPACDALAHNTSTVLTAGALSEAEPVELAALPSTSIPAFRVTPGLVTLLGGKPELAGAWISEGLAEALAVTPGTTLQTSTGIVTIAGIYDYPRDGRDNRLGFAMLVPVTPDQVFNECWATAWPLGESTDVLLRSSAFAPGSSEALQIGQLNKTHGTSFDGPLAFDSRITKYVYPLIAVVGLSLGWVSIRARRLEHAAALHAGQPRSAQVTTILVETAAWALLGSAVAGVAVLIAVIGTDALAAAASQPSAASMLPIVAPALPIAFGTTLLGASIAAFATRERHLFRYFKERR